MNEPQHSSSRAWSWRHAVGKSGLPPMTRLVLHTLGLKMDATGGSCFPPVSELVDLTGLDKKTVLKHLDVARENGWIEISKHGYAGQRWKRNEYTARWPGRDLQGTANLDSTDERGGAVPPRSEEEKVGEMAPEAGGNGGHKVGEQLHQDKILPTNIPSNSPAREEKADGQEDSKKVEAAFWKLMKAWPKLEGMPKQNYFAAWLKLTSADRQAASDAFPRWVETLKEARKDHFPVPSTYFSQRLWQDLPAVTETAQPRFVKAAPFGKLMMATRFADLLRKPYGVIGVLTANDQKRIERIEAARRGEALEFPLMSTDQRILDSGESAASAIWREKRMRHGWPLASEMADSARSGQASVCPIALKDASSSFHQVAGNGRLMDAWRAEHERRGWPFFDGRLPDWVWLPAIEDAAEDLQAAVRQALDGFAEQISDFLKARSKGDDGAA